MVTRAKGSAIKVRIDRMVAATINSSSVNPVARFALGGRWNFCRVVIFIFVVAFVRASSRRNVHTLFVARFQRNNFSFAPSGLAHFPRSSHGLRRGLYSVAASRLER